MAKKSYSSDSLYFTNRKEYYAQKANAKQSDNRSEIVTFNQADYEKAVGFSGGGWTERGMLGRSLDNSLFNQGLMSRFPNLAGTGTLYRKQDGYITIQESVWLCQKAWEEFQLFRNTIEAMVEFSLSKIKLSSKNTSAKNFCDVWLKSVNMYGFAEQFYREMYRSCNIFVYKIKGDVKAKDLTSLKTLSGGDKAIPVKYTILNPAQVALEGGVTADSEIYKVLSPYEIQRLKNPKTPTEQAIYNGLDPKIKEQIQKFSGISMTNQLYVKLEDVDSIFYQKQDYEYFAVPLFYGVLDDIELKLEMKKADRKVMATVESMILLITMGGMKGKEGQELAANPEHMAAIRKIFENKKIQRHLIADHTTKVNYVIPDISKVVGDSKYKQVNEDIREGLQSIFGSNEKFSNSMTKVKVFCERLKKGQEMFKNWLEGELESLCKIMGYSDVPEVILSSINLEDPTQANRVYTRMAELGYLTPEELNEAIETGILPTKEESLKNQREYKKHKEEDLYYPQLNYNESYNALDGQDGMNESNKKKKKSKQQPGRPTGSGTPLSAPRAPRATGGIDSISTKALGFVLGDYDKLEKSVSNEIKKLYKVKKLTEDHVTFAASLSKQIISNYPKNQWIESAAKVVKNKEIDNNYDMVGEIDDICNDFELEDSFLGALIYHSQK